MGEESDSDSMSESEESLDDSEVETSKKRKHVRTKPSSSKGKKKSKDKALQISSSLEEEVSEDSEKEESRSPWNEKTKISIQTRNKQKKQEVNVKELKEQVQRKNPDFDHNLEEETFGEGFELRIDGKVGKIIVGDISNKEKDNSGEKSPSSNPPPEGLKGFMDTIDWIITSYKKAVEDNKKLNHRVQILETISFGRGKSMAEQVSAGNTKILISKLEEEKDSLEIELDIEGTGEVQGAEDVLNE
ncbi:uncharacterized protein LOC131860246 [Cryptomeria japonica]|uniref:uncharacterized protein LOC131860246 n=1 Tax=Cryptomeria japonica TaxID=3369 RepID=UPI0027D9F15F|nr:uncharacterized protein LOC131860246 [Cryptomeria japonica]